MNRSWIEQNNPSPLGHRAVMSSPPSATPVCPSLLVDIDGYGSVEAGRSGAHQPGVAGAGPAGDQQVLKQVLEQVWREKEEARGKGKGHRNGTG